MFTKYFVNALSSSGEIVSSSPTGVQHYYKTYRQ